MTRYTDKAITTAEMIARLIDLAKHLREVHQQGKELGLSQEEIAFYDALAENGSAKEVMKSDTLRLMAREMTEMVKKMPKLDWTQRESVRADLRRSVRRLLAKYGYPPIFPKTLSSWCSSRRSSRRSMVKRRRATRPRIS